MNNLKHKNTLFSQRDQNCNFRKSYPSSKNNQLIAINELMNSFFSPETTLDISPIELHLVLDEVITNAMEHGNHWSPDRYVHVSLEKEGRSIIVKVEDEGAGFEMSDVSGSSDVLRKRGRGLDIVRQFCECRQEGRNVVVLWFKGVS